MRSRTGSSPHTRGAPVHVGECLRESRIIPAYAGSTNRTLWRCRGAGDHPRIRGEHKFRSPYYNAAHGSSPHTRGAPHGRTLIWLGARIIPAYAGSTTALASQAHSIADHPRIRGEHSSRLSAPSPPRGSSPHTRGAPARFSDGHERKRIIPAYAGSTPPIPSVPRRRRDHPRIRGEHSASSSSARARRRIIPAYAGSTLVLQSGALVELGIIPAYAGSTRRMTIPPRRRADHPRIRGEHGSTARMRGFLVGSSPHTRGAHLQQPQGARTKRIIPAYAGSTGSSPPAAARKSDHPRIRGEHVHIEAPRCPQMGSSPHTRGARDTVSERERGHGIIPAYAGSTPSRAFTAARRPDHPRIRGEHPAPHPSATRPSGSSPHTRGARA